MKATIVLLMLLIAAPVLAMDQYEYNVAMQRMQLEQARIQANGSAMMGMGAAFVNGMNANMLSMQRPTQVMPSLPTPTYMPVPAPRPLNCMSSNPGAMQSVTCY